MSDRPWEWSGPPIRVENGLATSKQRGPMAETWWSQRFITVLESYGLGGRMQRGRRYARTGQVVTLDVSPGVIAADVQGSRVTPYEVIISLPQPTAAQWKTIDAAIASKVGFAATLLSGEVPRELEAVFADAGVELFPRNWPDLRASCSCPDWGNPCKHIAAVLYVFADLLDADPWLVLAWRGRTREEVLDGLAVTSAASSEERVAPWWPFAPGPVPALDRGAPTPVGGSEVLDRMAPLDIEIGGTPLVDLLRPLYDRE